MQPRAGGKVRKRLKGQKREKKGRKHEPEKILPSATKQIRHIFKYQLEQIEVS